MEKLERWERWSEGMRTSSDGEFVRHDQHLDAVKQAVERAVQRERAEAERLTRERDEARAYATELNRRGLDTERRAEQAEAEVERLREAAREMHAQLAAALIGESMCVGKGDLDRWLAAFEEPTP